MILVWIGNVAHVDGADRGIAKTEGREGGGIAGREEMDPAEAVQAEEEALTQSDLFELGEFNNLAMDGQKSSNGLVGVEIMLGALVIEVFPQIGHQRNAKKSQHSEKEKRSPRAAIEDVKRRNRTAKKSAAPNCQKKRKRQLLQQRHPADGGRSQGELRTAGRLAHDAPNTRLKMASTCLKWWSRAKLASSSFSESRARTSLSAFSNARKSLSPPQTCMALR